MLEIIVPKQELFDDSKQEFFDMPEVHLRLEHSLVSVSKWESKWETPFLVSQEKTGDQMLDYIKCMTLSPEPDPEVYHRLTEDHLEAVNKYIGAKMTATWFTEQNPNANKGRRETITAELIYYWLVSLSIPFETENWHLNKLLTLIRVCNEKNQPSGKKMSKAELASRNRTLNAQRRAQMKTSG